MSQRRPPWFLGLGTLAALTLAHGASGPSPPVPPTVPRSLGQEGSPQPNAWAEYIRVYDDFLGRQHRPSTGQRTRRLRGTWAEQRVDLRLSAAEPEGGDEERDLEQVAEIARKDYDLEFLVALVPDPIDSRLPSNFDFTVTGLQMGLNQLDYLFDRAWHPWTAAAAAAAASGERLAHGTAGIMLFHKPQPETTTKLLAVFLVGETPKGGINRQAFNQAVTFIACLQHLASLPSSSHGPPRGSGCRPRNDQEIQKIRVLGPSFSGSKESLKAEMLSLSPLRFSVVSGSATAPGLECYFEKGVEKNVSFARTVVPDDQLIETALSILHEKLGWDLRRVALLIEDDTAYGKGISSPPPKDDRCPVEAGEPLPEIRLPFPSGLSAIRNAWEESGNARGANESKGTGKELAIGVPKPALEINLADRGTPADSVLELSPLTSRIEEMAMASLLRTIPRRDIRYVGIVATDVKDAVFLAEQVRRWAPDVTLALFESNLIYVHPHFRPALFGSLVITSFPMLTNEVAPDEVRQFGTETQKGIFLATQCLLGAPIEPPAVWIAATGNDTLSPVVKQELTDLSFAESLCSLTPSPSGVNPPKVRIFPEGNELQLLFVLVAVGLLAYWFGQRVYLPSGVAPDAGAHPVDSRVLLVLGAAVLVVLGAGIVVLAFLPVYREEYFDAAAKLHGGLHLAFLIMTALAYLCLLLFLATKVAQAAAGLIALRTARSRRFSVVAIGVAMLLVGVLVCWELAQCTLGRWSLGHPGFLYLRLRRFANGLSPLVSLLWLGGALVAWIGVELRRQQLRLRHHFQLPIPDREEALSGCLRKLQAIDGVLDHTLPASWGFWGLVLVAMVPTAALLWKKTQPLADPRAYGHIFVTMVLGAFVLSAASFYRFGATWGLLRQLLGRLEHCRCRRSFAGLASVVQWNPMQAFVWYTPSFSSLAQVAARLEALERSGFTPAGLGGLEAARQFRAACEAEAAGSFACEVAARQSVAAIGDKAGEHLAGAGSSREAEDLYALRVVAYLRFVFVQLRYALMGAMVPALLLIVALNTYTFVPSRLMLALFWTALLTASAVSLVVFVQMDRDVVLSEIGQREPGKVILDHAFLSNVFAYAVLPLLALISSQIPEVARALGHWLDPLTRLLEIG
jgi:hypothetical protein